jgi:hypothetical protein
MLTAVVLTEVVALREAGNVISKFFTDAEFAPLELLFERDC